MRIRTSWTVVLAVSAALAAVCGGAHAQKVTGDWHGTLDYNGNTTPIEVTLKAKAGGGYRGTFRATQKTFPLKDIKLNKGALSFSSGSGNYSGRWDETRKAWVGQWIFKMTVVGPSGAAPPTTLTTIPMSPLVLTAEKQ